MSIKYELSAQLEQFCDVYKYPKRPKHSGNQFFGELNWCQFTQFMNGLIMDQSQSKFHDEIRNCGCSFAPEHYCSPSHRA